MNGVSFYGMGHSQSEFNFIEKSKFMQYANRLEIGTNQTEIDGNIRFTLLACVHVYIVYRA